MDDQPKAKDPVEDQAQPKYNAVHFRWLSEGVEAWNAWRNENSEVIPNLEGADLSGAALEGANLLGANLEGANLRRANLKEASLFRVKLNGADLFGANLQRATLRRANLEETNLFGANLEGVDLSGANLERADLRGARGISLDSTFTRDAQFDARAKDRWSQLRQSYTGPRMLFTLLFLVAFFIPYLVKTAGWVVANQVQEEVSLGLSELDALADGTELGDESTRALLRSIAGSLRSRVPWDQPQGWSESRVWKLGLGLEREWTYWLTGLALIVFNLFRALLTFVVAPMRDAEERSGWSPGLRPRAENSGELLKNPGAFLEVYGWLWWPHVAVRVLWWVAVGSFLFHAWHWLTLPVWIPA